MPAPPASSGFADGAADAGIVLEGASREAGAASRPGSGPRRPPAVFETRRPVRRRRRRGCRCRSGRGCRPPPRGSPGASASGSRSSRTLQERTIPEVQKPHCRASAAMKASWSGVRRPSAARPSIVVMGLPGGLVGQHRQEQTVLPSRSTVQAPQAPRPQTTLVPVRPIRSRRASTSVTRGSTESVMRGAVDLELEGRGAGPDSVGRRPPQPWRRRRPRSRRRGVPRTRSRRVKPPLRSRRSWALPAATRTAIIRPRGAVFSPAGRRRVSASGPGPGRARRRATAPAPASARRNRRSASRSLDRRAPREARGSRPARAAPRSARDLPGEGAPRPVGRARRRLRQREGVEEGDPGEAVVVRAGGGGGSGEPAGELPAAGGGDAGRGGGGAAARARAPGGGPSPGAAGGESGVDLGEPRAPGGIELVAHRACEVVPVRGASWRRPRRTWGSDTAKLYQYRYSECGNRPARTSSFGGSQGQKKGARRPPRNRVEAVSA